MKRCRIPDGGHIQVAAADVSTTSATRRKFHVNTFSVASPGKEVAKFVPTCSSQNFTNKIKQKCFTLAKVCELVYKKS
jgi:hypothetical protein